MERILDTQCNIHGVLLISDCPVCGAPTCCPICCREATSEILGSCYSCKHARRNFGDCTNEKDGVENCPLWEGVNLDYHQKEEPIS